MRGAERPYPQVPMRGGASPYSEEHAAANIVRGAGRPYSQGLARRGGSSPHSGVAGGAARPYSQPQARVLPRRQPQATTTLRVVVVNCESLRSQAKNALFNNMIDGTKPDIILGTESWLDSHISSSEIFPEGFTIFRKDREELVNREVFGPMQDNSSHGGVFIAIKSNITCTSVPEMAVDAEII